MFDFRPTSLLLLLLPLGCSSGDASPDRAPRENAAVNIPLEAPHVVDAGHLPLPRPTGERQVGVRLTEYQIELTRDTVESGEVEFHVVNAGTTIHYLLVRSQTVYSLTPHLPPGDSAVMKVDLAPGEYQYLCTIRDEYDHYSEGMRGTLVVQ